MALVLPLALAGCAGGDSRETVYVTSTQWVDPDTGDVVEQEEPTAAASSWQDEYEWVLDHPGDYPVNSAAQYTPDGTYEYALVEANGGGTPELLLSVSGGHTRPIIVFTIGDDGKAHPSPEVLIMGTPGNGAAREAVWSSVKGEGLYQISGSSQSREFLSRRFVLDGASLSPAEEQSFPTEQPLPDHQGITYTPVSDKQPLRDGALTVHDLSDPMGAAAGGTDSAANTGDNLQAAEGQTEMVGTVVVKTGQELMAPRGLGMPNGEDPNSTYILLWFDEPQTIFGLKGGSDGETKTVEYGTLGANETSQSGYSHTHGLQWEQYVGKRVKIVANQDQLFYPSDASMPVGALRIAEDVSFTVLN